MGSLRDSVIKNGIDNPDADTEKETAAVIEAIGKKNKRWGNADENKAISAWVNKKSYEKFTRINKARGLSNNKTLNLLISDYVLKNEDLIQD